MDDQSRNTHPPAKILDLPLFVVGRRAFLKDSLITVTGGALLAGGLVGIALPAYGSRLPFEDLLLPQAAIGHIGWRHGKSRHSREGGNPAMSDVRIRYSVEIGWRTAPAGYPLPA